VRIVLAVAAATAALSVLTAVAGVGPPDGIAPRPVLVGSAGRPATEPTEPSPPRPYSPPVDAPVVDPFRPPATPYGPGNRGLEYATVPGTPARAIGAGTVTFAGPVAGRGVVTVEHPDGLRSSLTGLVEVRVTAGDRVDRGQVLGTTAATLHLGVRRGDDYVDPAALFGAGPPVHAVLVPVPG
jgi:murein DD-endopeptidase MepM/ murein hydrolase activator NlpD